MKKNLIVLTICSVLSNINADEPKSSVEPLVIKVIDVREIAMNSIEGKELEAEIGNLRNKIESDFKKMEADIEKDMTELRSKARIIGNDKEGLEVLEKEQERIMRKKKEFETKLTSSQEEFQRTVQRKTAKFQTSVANTTIQKAKSLNWDIVPTTSGEIIYISDRANGSPEITKALDTKRRQEKSETAKKLAAPVKAPGA
ncbi:MAG: OmpH family outer membrane protein [Candidatus Babeliales bacterium]|nr:OmpH family outer membrane protein [Candidatus Babeliales bacterium]